MSAAITQLGRCTTCCGPTFDNVNDGCTTYTCTTPCSLCTHPGDVHRDWYRKQLGAGFCRRCRSDGPSYRHDYHPGKK